MNPAAPVSNIFIDRPFAKSAPFYRPRCRGPLSRRIGWKLFWQCRPMSTARIRKAVFPVAGMGTRFLPATKAIPKEMLPVVDKPVIQYAVEEAREAGIEQLIFVTGRGKQVIYDIFVYSF